MKKILIPIDSGEVCPKLLAYAKEYADKFGTEIHVVHVVHQHEYGIDPYTEAHYHQINNIYEINYTLGEEYVKQVGDELRSLGAKVVTNVIKGNISGVICKYAEEHELDMIMMCSHRYNVVQRFLLGSTTTKVIHHAKVPVLVIR